MTNWYNMGCDDVVQQLESDLQRGLGQEEAARRLVEHGPNELLEKGRKSPWVILWEQLVSTMVVILLIAATVSMFLGDYEDAAAILAIVVLNTLLGYVQENRAEKAMAALKRLSIPVVKVRRSGSIHEVPARDLVPGDIVLLEVGALVPADGRVLEAANLRIQEAVLTGESEAAEKAAHTLRGEHLALGDRRNMAYMGTTVSYGRGVGIVTETGMSTELGRIATLIQKVDREATPLQRRLDRLGKVLAAIALVIVAIVFTLGLLRGEDLQLMFLTAVSLAVAAVPEGLPAVVTIALALGAQRMLKRNALIRKLPAVETLGAVTVICSDKTGTLTENLMTVALLDVAGDRLDIRESAPLENSVPISDVLLLVGGALCNDAELHAAEGEQGSIQGQGRFHAVGDPTEGSLVVAAARFGLYKADLERALPRVGEVPFESGRKRMTTVHRLPADPDSLRLDGFALPDGMQAALDSPTMFPVSNADEQPSPRPCAYIAFTKGAVDSLLQVCSRVWTGEQAEALSNDWRHRIVAANNELARDGMRVLGVAFRLLDAMPDAEEAGATPGPEGQHAGGPCGGEEDLTFIGMVGMIDPARPEVKDAVQTCITAGIRPVMITGDHALTARYIARQLGILVDDAANEVEGPARDSIMTGQELDRLEADGGTLGGAVENVAVYARVSPEHKLNIVGALQGRGHIVAMTGDGVNDAPALKKADIGIAMGITGTDVSKEAADMVLLDDNFATIVAAVQEGRVIYDNIRKFVKYLMATNSAEIWVMLLAPLLGMPLPLLPLQILWVNLVTDGLPALALAVEPAERDVMRRPPYRPGESILDRGMGIYVLWTGLLMAAVTLGAGYWYWQSGQGGQGLLQGQGSWQTMLFTILALSQMASVLGVRSGRVSLFRAGLLSNKALLGAVGLTLGLQLLVIYVPFLQRIFGTVALGVWDLGLALLLSSTIFWAVELQKWFARRRG